MASDTFKIPNGDIDKVPGKISKGFYLSSIAVGFGIAVMLLILAQFRTRSGHPEAGVDLIGVSLIPMLYGTAVITVLLYKSWAAIEDDYARTTPGKAIGFLFIPLFNIYWTFQSIWGLSKDFNDYLYRHTVSTTKLSEGLFLAYCLVNCVLCILSFTIWIPLLGLVLLIAQYIISLRMVSSLCDAINAVAEKSVQQ